MADLNDEHSLSYFGACNSYRGFVSYFDEIFSPTTYDRIYVIKGGPGTGKSSFMKKIFSEFKKTTAAEIIYCSSDPSSLDGVILEHNNKRVALIDGTAPHQTDAKIPGAVDEIINMGDFWDKKWLVPQRERILELNLEKKRSYNAAYQYLSIAGRCNETELSVFCNSYNKSESKKKALEIASSFNFSNNTKTKNRLVSSFGKNGQYSLNTFNLLGNKALNIDIPDVFLRFFMDDLKSMLDSFSIQYTAFPCAPDNNLFEAFYIEKDDTLIGRIGRGEKIDLSRLTEYDIQIEKERVRVASELKRFALDEAKREFSIASELHFSLEKIYSSAMNFNILDDQINKYKNEIKEILEL